ncbi:AbrB/MazE/SpoVT family DNA-binding domain-containing protein [Longimicrobium sp.]|uniref:AbrB/MazE/SpoVT family DNA-binding domain-containing protein n=1 Tax=Longimicrobium sp. TaxID=2029185 RepID=UPI003B3B3A04
MRARVVRIGNSRGIRIPKPMLEQSGIVDEVDLQAEDGQIVIRAVRHPREGWDAAFAEMAQRGDDKLLDDVPSTSTWDEEEWEW